MNPDRNLLASVLALQLGCCDASELIAAMQTWAFDRDVPMEELLVRSGAIDREQADTLRRVVDERTDREPTPQTVSAANLTEATLTGAGLTGATLPGAGSDTAESNVVTRDGDSRSTSVDLDIIPGRPSLSEPDTRTAVDPVVPVLSSPDAANEAFDRAESGRYRLRSLYAKGGLGEVHVATDQQLHREVAVKKIQSRFDDNESSLARFLVEAEITGRLEHPGIVPVYSLGRDENRKPYYAMKLIRGRSLKEAIGALHRRDTGQSAIETDPQFRSRVQPLVSRLLTACQTLAYAHSRGVIHRDIKPSNIMLGRYGETLIVDWGLAKFVGRESQHVVPTQPPSDESTLMPNSGSSTGQTRIGSVIGTVAYMSPEQAMGQIDRLGPATDIYAIGATLYVLLTNRYPVEPVDGGDTIEAVRRGALRPAPAAVNQAVPELVAICRKSMAYQPGQRYSNMEALADDLQRWIAGQPVTACPESFARRTRRWVRKHQTFVSTIGSLMVLSIIGLTIFSSVVASKNRRLRTEQNALRESKTNFRDFGYSILSAAERRIPISGPGSPLREALFRDCYEQFRTLAAEETDPVFQRSYADAVRVMGTAARQRGDLDAAIGYYDEAGEALTRLIAQLDPDDSPDARRERALATARRIGVLNDKVDVLRFQNQYARAEASVGRARELLNQADTLIDTDTYDGAVLMGQTLLYHAQLAGEREAYDTQETSALESIKWLTEAQRLYREAYGGTDGNSEVFRQQAVESLAEARTEQGQYEKCRKQLSEQIEYIRMLLDKYRVTRNRTYMLAMLLDRQLANDIASDQVTAASIQPQREAIQIIEARLDEGVTQSLAVVFARLQTRLADAQRRLDHLDASAQAAQRAIDVARPLAETSDASAAVCAAMADALDSMAQTASLQSDRTRSEKLRVDALRWADQAAQRSEHYPRFVSLKKRIASRAEAPETNSPLPETQ